MRIFQVILLFLGVILLVVTRVGLKTSIKAGYRIGFVLFICLFFIFTFFPNLTQFIAEIVQIGRGADLILYMTAFSLISFALIVIIKFEKLNNQITILTRNLAINNLEGKKIKKSAKKRQIFNG